MPKFMTTIMSGGGNTAGIVIPPEIVESLGKGKKPPVVVTLNGKSYRNTVAVMGGKFMVGVSAENRELTGVKVGDKLEVTLELDTAPRTVDVPEDLAAALAAKPGATEAFEASAPSKKKEFVRQVNEAKSQETRDRRIANIVDKLP